MNLITVECPNCGASMHIENGIDTFYCSHCGSRLFLGGQSTSEINAKANIIILDKLIDQKRYERDLDEKEKRRLEKKSEKENIIAGVFLAVAFILMGVGIYSMIRSQDRAVEAENARLEAIYDEVVECVNKGDYQSALLKVNRLRYSITSEKNTYEKLWDARRNDLIATIELIRNGE